MRVSTALFPRHRDQGPFSRVHEIKDQTRSDKKEDEPQARTDYDVEYTASPKLTADDSREDYHRNAQKITQTSITKVSFIDRTLLLGLFLHYACSAKLQRAYAHDQQLANFEVE